VLSRGDSHPCWHIYSTRITLCICDYLRAARCLTNESVGSWRLSDTTSYQRPTYCQTRPPPPRNSRVPLAGVVDRRGSRRQRCRDETRPGGCSAHSCDCRLWHPSKRRLDFLCVGQFVLGRVSNTDTKHTALWRSQGRLLAGISLLRLVRRLTLNETHIFAYRIGMPRQAYSLARQSCVRCGRIQNFGRRSSSGRGGNEALHHTTTQSAN
jgi:hypothetical protein